MVPNLTIGFLTNTKDVHSSVGTMFICSLLYSQDVKALQDPFANKIFANVYAALHIFSSVFEKNQKLKNLPTTPTKGKVQGGLRSMEQVKR